MKLKMKYLRHPLRTAANARNRVAQYVDIKRFGDRSESLFRGDVRFDLENVSRGLRSHTGDLSGDAELLERICTAYNKSLQQEQFAPEAYQASAWWQQVRQLSLGPVIHALQTRDIDALGNMYRNFFRDPCAAGLIGVPCGMSEIYFGGTIKDVYRRFFLGDALYGMDYWTLQTGGRFPLRELTGPEIGNPFGISIDGTLIRTGAVYQHYSAQRISDCLDSGTGVVAEIGGGFGGMAYYLLRDRPGLTYLDFDLPESIALTTYYLLKAFPHLNFLLYGENELTAENLARTDVALMPTSEIEKMPRRSVDVAFSSHAMSDISCEAMGDYLETIARITRSHFVYIGNGHGAESISNLATEEHHPFRLIETRPSGWQTHKYPEVDDVECLYRVGAD
ncbi:MAG: putative sugar O-methyltransferase [Silvibacterium sp.]